MENRFLLRLSLAAALLAQSAGAAAGTIEGTVAFPGLFVPSMTVYAAEVDTSKVRTVQLARGQSSFTVDVPPGRYVIFLAPNEPGAPDIYGAFTQYSRCAPRDVDGKCEDHSLITLAMTARGARSTVSIDDWYLTDDVVEQINRIRGAAAGGAGRFNSQPLGAPRFSEYPSAPFEGSAAPKIDFNGGEFSDADRASIQQSLSEGPNFAGHVTAVLAGCGTACARLVLVDWMNGRLQTPAAVAEIRGKLPCREEDAVLFRRDSRLLSVTRLRDAAVVTQYYVWNQGNAALLPSGEYQRTPQAFCAVAAR
jgi:hypothetical protein